jgi:hypothetical protein
MRFINDLFIRWGVWGLLKVPSGYRELWRFEELVLWRVRISWSISWTIRITVVQKKFYFRFLLILPVRMELFFSSFHSFIHWKRMIRSFLFIDKQKRKLSIHELVDFWLANVSSFDFAFRFAVGSFTENVWFVLVYWQTKANMLTLMLHETENVWFVLVYIFWTTVMRIVQLIDHDILILQRTIGLVLTHSSFH